MLSKIESNDWPYVKAGSSSAPGLYKFMKSTWIGNDGWKAVGRICRWVVENGARLTFECPASPATP
ncbi:hypothetical protein [Brevundimonas sp.]|uniref:hypothetical protein n=1 Tax=Brevundimonas sp. TaxID=1871086 RepID=UPI003BAD5807